LPLDLATTCSIASELIAKIARARDQLLVFCSFPGEVEPTNNGCERALRPAVIQRKVTNGYRAMWAAEYETAVRSTVDTARLAGAGSFQTMPSNHRGCVKTQMRDRRMAGRLAVFDCRISTDVLRSMSF
jgi:transposase IS66 family protein